MAITSFKGWLQTFGFIQPTVPKPKMFDLKWNEMKGEKQ